MEKIKLARAKRGDEWVIGYPIETKTLTNKIITLMCPYGNSINIDTPLLQIVDPSTLEYATGFFDKNNKPIFCGDILENDSIYPFNSNYYAVIGYADDIKTHIIIFVKRKDDSTYGMLHGTTEFIHAYNLEEFNVVGNIVDNIDLVEEEVTYAY